MSTSRNFIAVGCKVSLSAVSILSALFLTSCGWNSFGSDQPGLGDKHTIILQFDDNQSGWSAGFSDYPIIYEADYQLMSGVEQLPPPLENTMGLNVSGNNHSDDLFMFVKKRFAGFAPNQHYQLSFEITFATNVPNNCIGSGGSPGEGVTVKAGASVTEPLAVNDGNGYYRMNIDKGDQSVGGSDAITIGDFANSKPCEDDNFNYELKTLDNSSNPFSVFTDDEGALWLLFGTDSGFEAITSIYYVSGRVVATKID